MISSREVELGSRPRTRLCLHVRNLGARDQARVASLGAPLIPYRHEMIHDLSDLVHDLRACDRAGVASLDTRLSDRVVIGDLSLRDRARVASLDAPLLT